MDALAAASEALPEVIELRRKIHANPELGNELPDTRQAVLDALAGLDLDIRYSQETSSIVATLHGVGNGPRIMLRGDMDALPMPENNQLPFASKNNGKMHACGHDAHTAMLVGAAKVLHARHRDINGSIDFLFQTGEEGYFGAKLVLDEGLFDVPNSPDAVFAIHITPLLETGKVTSRTGTILAAADVWKMVVKGKGGHASMPHDCLDPIPVACDIVKAFQSFVAGRINAFDPVVLTTTKIEAGTTTNVIPEIANVLGTLRSTSEKSRKLALEGMARLSKQIAIAHEVEAEITIERGYPVTVNEDKFVDFARQCSIEILGENRYVPMRSPMMGAEDFSYFLQRWPGAIFFLGVKPDDPALAEPCHSSRMIINEAGMAHGIALHTGIAMKWLDQQSGS